MLSLFKSFLPKNKKIKQLYHSILIHEKNQEYNLAFQKLQQAYNLSEAADILEKTAVYYFNGIGIIHDFEKAKEIFQKPELQNHLTTKTYVELIHNIDSSLIKGGSNFYKLMYKLFTQFDEDKIFNRGLFVYILAQHLINRYQSKPKDIKHFLITEMEIIKNNKEIYQQIKEYFNIDDDLYKEITNNPVEWDRVNYNEITEEMRATCMDFIQGMQLTSTPNTIKPEDLFNVYTMITIEFMRRYHHLY